MNKTTDNGQRTTDKLIALFDSGNSRLHFSWWDGETLENPVSVPYPGNSEELTTIIHQCFTGNIPHKVAACSVSSRWRETLFKAIDLNSPGKLVVARTAYDIPIRVTYDKPEIIGIDRVLAAYAAFRYFHDSCVVIDSGTAVTVDAVGGDGVFAGGYIFPGLHVLSRCLSDKTDLPEVSLSDSCEGIGNNTETCISFGIPIGYSGAVAELVKHASSIVGDTTRVVITGGGAENLLPFLTFPAVHKPYLVLEGLGYSIDSLPEYESQIGNG